MLCLSVLVCEPEHPGLLPSRVCAGQSAETGSGQPVSKAAFTLTFLDGSAFCLHLSAFPPHHGSWGWGHAVLPFSCCSGPFSAPAGTGKCQAEGPRGTVG